MSSEFDKSLQALLHLGDCFKRREKQLKQQYNTKFNKQKNEFNVQLQKEKERIEQLQDTNRALIHQIEEMTEKQINFNAVIKKSNTKNLSISCFFLSRL
jgi:ATP-dependent 26S proteasome regulatory subunit